MSDKFSTMQSRVHNYGRRATAVTKSDSVDDPAGPGVLYVVTAGNVKFTCVDDLDAAALTLAVTAGQEIPFVVRKVWATGTTAGVVFKWV